MKAHWDEKFETMPIEQMQIFQLDKLRQTVAWVKEKIPFYRKALEEKGIGPDDLRSLDDIRHLPLTVKTDLRDNYPFGLCAVPVEELVRIHASSGTTGKPITGPYTAEDLDQWAECMARNLWAAGIHSGDIAQNALGHGLFTGGLGFYQGAMKIGATIIPSSSGMTERQVNIMRDFGSTVLFATPSYALTIAEKAAEMGVDVKELPLRVGVFGAEPWSDSIRREIEELWNMLATDVYGLSEIIGPGVAQECSHKDGLHIFSDVFYPEIINPDTGEEVAEGEDGELVITTLTKQAIPLIRYRTRDIVSIKYEKCRCGRTSPRISKIKGRTDDMIVVRGINVFPSQIEHVLVGIKGTQPYYQIVVDRKAHKLDEVEVLVEVEEKIFSDEIKELKELQDKIKKEIGSVLSIGVKVTLVEPKTIERSMGKSKRIIDKRTL